MTEILLVSSGAICQQGSERDPSTAAARTLLIALFVMAVQIYTAYSASLISLISFLPNTDREIHGWSAGNKTAILLQDTNFFKYHHEVSRPKAELTSLQNGLERVLGVTEDDSGSVAGTAGSISPGASTRSRTTISSSNIAFIADRDVTLTTIHQLGFGPERRCSLARAFLGLEYQRVFAIRLNSTFIDAINYNILKLRQHGLLSREKARMFNKESICNSKERAAVSGFVSVDFSDTLPAIMLLLWGITFALTFFFVECIIYYSWMEIRTTFSKSWREAEDHAGRVLNRWLKSKLKSAFKKNEGLVLEEKPQIEKTNRLRFQP